MSEHNYRAAILRAIRDGQLTAPPGEVSVVEVLHDGCWIWGGDRCDCEPEIRQRPAEGETAGDSTWNAHSSASHRG